MEPDPLDGVIEEVAELERGFASFDYERAVEFGDPKANQLPAMQDPVPTPVTDQLRAEVDRLRERAELAEAKLENLTRG